MMRTPWIVASAVGIGWSAATLVLAAPAAKVTPPASAPGALPASMKANDLLAAQAQALLTENCVSCHGPKVQQAGLRLDSQPALLLPGASGKPAMVPGSPEKSALLAVIRYDGPVKMPPRGKLPQAAIDTLSRWIATGAPWPAAKAASPPAGAAAPLQHWAYQPLKQPSLPKVKNPSWVGTPVDRYILAALEQKGLTPASPVERRKLLRRVTFDLTGLPPTPEEVDQFERDCEAEEASRKGAKTQRERNGREKMVAPATPPPSPISQLPSPTQIAAIAAPPLSPNSHPPSPTQGAYEKLVDRLLASPAYGERWGRHWLDLARYADSDGQESDQDRPTAYHYRDFVIRALNDDLPYRTFVQWQLAGDEIEPDNPEAVSATGFLTAGTHAVLDAVPMEEEKVRERYNELDNIVSTTGTTFLGMTIGCARCHDHKYDPIPTKDYYRLVAAFNSGDRADVPLLPPGEVAARKAAEQEWKARLDAAKKAGDQNAIRALEGARPPAVPTALTHHDFGATPRESWLLDRGDFHHRKEPVELGFLSVLCRDRSPAAYWSDARARGSRTDTTYQRRAMAEWITDTEHGAGALLARVIVNRVWQGHFGEGLVRTVNDFGKRSEVPTHPALLEWLASDLVRGGWRLKSLHRTILLSAAYQQGTARNMRASRLDPENRLLWHRTLRRVEAEAYRDSMLSVAGSLNPAMYGPGFKPPIQPDAIQARNVKTPYPKDAKDTPETRRRSVYMFHKRVTPYPLIQAFDGPDSSAPCGRRNVTTVAPQALAVLNEPFIRLRALELARRLQAEAGADPAAQVRRAYRLALGRAPTVSELDASVRFVQGQTAAHTVREPGAEPSVLALADFAQVIFGLNEFLYVD